MIRLVPQVVSYALRTAVKLLVHCAGGIDAAAACVRVGRSQISAYGDIDGYKWIPIDVLLALEIIVGRPIVTEIIASVQGYALVKITARETRDLINLLLQCQQGAGQLIVDSAAALSDGELSKRERMAVGLRCTEVGGLLLMAGRTLTADAAS